MVTENYDLIVVGSGIGGYPAALIASRKGMKVALIEKEKVIGGECTNYGCVPSKALIYYSHVLSEAIRLGIATKGRENMLNYALEYARRIVEEDREGLRSLFDRLGVEVIEGQAVLKTKGGDTVVEVKDSELKARNILLAPGSEPLWPNWVKKCERIVDNRGFFAKGLPSYAESIAIIGGGVIGVEFAQILATVGYNVTIYEAMQKLLPVLEDNDLSRIARRLLVHKGVMVELGKPITKLLCRNNRVELCTNRECRVFDAAILAIGRRPYTGPLGLREAGVSLDEKGFIRVRDDMSTTLKGVYAAGDAVGQPFLAHKASMESITVISSILGRKPPSPKAIPMVVYGDIEIALVKPSKPICKDCRPRVVKNYWGYNTIVRIRGIKAQLVYARITYDEKTGRVLEAAVAGPEAANIIAELTLAVEAGVSINELRSTSHPHPSAAEAVLDLVLSATGEIFNRV